MSCPEYVKKNNEVFLMKGKLTDWVATIEKKHGATGKTEFMMQEHGQTHTVYILRLNISLRV